MRLNTLKKTHEENLNKKQTQKQAEYLNKQNLKAPKTQKHWVNDPGRGHAGAHLPTATHGGPTRARLWGTTRQLPVRRVL